MSLAFEPAAAAAGAELLRCDNVALGFGSRVIQSQVSFSVRRGSIFAVMGGSGSGKSTVLRAMCGLSPPLAGKVLIEGEDLWAASGGRRGDIGRRFGVLFQSGALWSSLTVGENVALPLEMLSRLDARAIAELVRLKLALVGMASAEDKLPSALSGGMRKRAGLARALALDPDILFFDEPSAGLDPITSRRLDELILELRDGLGATVVIVSHELPSLFAICDDGVFLDADAKTAIGHGAPRDLRDHSTNPTVQAFMRRALPDDVAPPDSSDAVR
jgi:phospholipid/cholesterol/gamma-HCH transport system ATP-binding protein